VTSWLFHRGAFDERSSRPQHSPGQPVEVGAFVGRLSWCVLWCLLNRLPLSSCRPKIRLSCKVSGRYQISGLKEPTRPSRTRYSVPLLPGFQAVRRWLKCFAFFVSFFFSGHAAPQLVTSLAFAVAPPTVLCGPGLFPHSNYFLCTLKVIFSSPSNLPFPHSSPVLSYRCIPPLSSSLMVHANVTPAPHLL